ncbi:alpha-ketoglutarate-dependent dioxygenase AlkB family protein [Mucilaginibacter sp. E4BP6]|uniref:alpha-ketoglutarate-dependent dioxygenase AlkB family protein n=1 Tax=Mucilaginibacter sp. E4BP6 TaxID=2723089 RepID=UPI0015CA5096|nr:alpha-ketoglutarate-dependent dioxygenase AlkB [Mucilaginibacter sp. E4BP6]NYE66100.1 alkylated DNA repair dioxygenase AlkB [Mucilaginibacter sp. E4BP6]
MTQLNFFTDAGPSANIPAELVDYVPGLFNENESNFYMQKFINKMPWQQKSVLMYGKEVITPRLTVWYGDPDVDYSISGSNARPLIWTKELLEIKSKIEPLAGVKFDSVLLNYYRDGNDSVSWHSDNDGIPGRNRIVGSVSFGQERNFDIRNKEDHQIKYSVTLENGSYLLMKEGFQEGWQHRIAKSTKPMKPRVNLTFRLMR